MAKKTDEQIKEFLDLKKSADQHKVDMANTEGRLKVIDQQLLNKFKTKSLTAAKGKRDSLVKTIENNNAVIGEAYESLRAEYDW